MEQCANCNRQIGNLETPHIHMGSVVCSDCKRALQGTMYSNGVVYAGSSHVRSGGATASLVLGIIGLLAWMIPIIGLPITIVGLVTGVRAADSASRTTGIVLSIIGLVLTIINASIGAYMGANGQL